MEYNELRARLAKFFANWNAKYAPAGRVNCLKIKMTDHHIDYVFNGQALCRIGIYSDQECRSILGKRIEEAEKQLLLSILETTSGLATNPQLQMINDQAERAETIVLLLRLYHGLEDEVVCSFPEVRSIFNRKYFQRINSQEKRVTLMDKMEDFREALVHMISTDEIPVRRVERRVAYLNQMSIAELCILLNAAAIETASTDWSVNVKTASNFIRKLCY